MTTETDETAVLNFVRAQVSARTKVPLEDVHASSGLIDLGLQSIDAVLLCGEVEDEFQVELDPSTIFEHETLGSFVAVVVERLSAS